MTLNRSATAETNTRDLLLPFSIGIVAAMAIVQAVIALTGGDITVLAATLTAVVAIGLAIWILYFYRRLARVRFGVVIAHAIAYVTVTTSFNIHAIFRTMAIGSKTGNAAAVAENFFGSPWFGATLIMSAAWGLGLLIHLVGTVLGRGWED